MSNTERTYSIPGGDTPGTQWVDEHQQEELGVFEYTDDDNMGLEQDLDPNNNFLASLNSRCCYYTDEQFNQNINSQGKFSLIHFNSRSLYANFSNIKEYLQTFLQPFSIIAISETWINTEKGLDFELDGYKFMYNNRLNKRGGGVALYIHKSLNYRVLEGMTTVVDNLLECLTIEICMDKSKNIIISCIYRAPGSNISTFCSWMETKFSKLVKKKLFLFVGILILIC